MVVGLAWQYRRPPRVASLSVGSGHFVAVLVETPRMSPFDLLADGQFGDGLVLVVTDLVAQGLLFHVFRSFSFGWPRP